MKPPSLVELNPVSGIYSIRILRSNYGCDHVLRWIDNGHLRTVGYTVPRIR